MALQTTHIIPTHAYTSWWKLVHKWIKIGPQFWPTQNTSGPDTSLACLLIYMSETHDQQRCTISKVAADWREELMMPAQHIMSSAFVYDTTPW